MLSISNLREAFHLPLSVQAHEELRALQQDVSSVTLSEGKDVWICTWGAQLFKTTDYYKFFFREVNAHAAFGWLWKAKSVPKIKVFGWLLLMDRLNTRDMMQRRH